MHGFIILEFEKFVLTTYGFPAWAQILRQAGLVGKEYTALVSYPDEEMFSMVAASVHQTGVDQEELMRNFGHSLAPNLLRVYRSYLDPSWRTMDLLEHAEKGMHKAVRGHDAAQTPPILDIARQSQNHLTIDYRSPRRLSALALGIVEGVAAYYGEQDRIHIDLVTEEDGGASRITVRFF